MSRVFHTYLGLKEWIVVSPDVSYSGELGHIIEKLVYHFSLRFIEENSSQLVSHMLLFLKNSY